MPILRPDKGEPTTVGWREWVSLPDWSVDYLKAKVDTGARTSSIHAADLEWFTRADAPWVRFEIHPWQRSSADCVVVEAPAVDARAVRSSSGDAQRRPVVRATLVVAGRTVTTEVNLTRRDTMGFRMLLGRQVLKQNFVVDPRRSYLGGRPPKSVRSRNRRAEDLDLRSADERTQELRNP